MIERVLAIPPKRFDRRLVTFLIEPEIDALLAAPESIDLDRAARPRFVWACGSNGPARVGTDRPSLHRCPSRRRRAYQLHGKGRSCDHTTHLGHGRRLARLACRAGRKSGGAAVRDTNWKDLSRDALEHRLAKHVEIAAGACPSLGHKKVTMHVLRHSAAMRLLRAGIDTSVIALWLGHEQIETTQIYLHADLELKERALAKTMPATTAPGRYRPPDKLLAFLEAL